MSKKESGMSELNGYIPKALKLKFKSLGAACDRSMSEVLAELMQEWIKSQEDKSLHANNDDE
ncbi:plasmid partition protein ParG [Coleofasciculus sp. G2-EDA-02]|uniref:plasmid partition protein ParG n=1 Tax=Coleofasciculus sp. G2-EDA-02 TaxID=3069529 RepID=UPI0032FD5227